MVLGNLDAIMASWNRKTIPVKPKVKLLLECPYNNIPKTTFARAQYIEIANILHLSHSYVRDDAEDLQRDGFLFVGNDFCELRERGFEVFLSPYDIYLKILERMRELEKTGGEWNYFYVPEISRCLGRINSPVWHYLKNLEKQGAVQTDPTLPQKDLMQIRGWNPGAKLTHTGRELADRLNLQPAEKASKDLV